MVETASGPSTLYDWLATKHAAYEVTSLADLLTVHQNITLYALAVSERMTSRGQQGGLGFLWRGQRDWHWGIQTSLYRHVRRRVNRVPTQVEFERREQQIWSAFVEAGLNTASSLMANLALMEHHGVPTRLLDVSTDFWPALYFACEPQAATAGEDEAGLVLGFGLSRSSQQISASVRSLDILRARLSRSRTAMLYRPLGVTPRIWAQRGAFLVGAYYKGSGERLTFRWQVPEWSDDTFAAMLTGKFRIGRPLENAPLLALRIPAKVKAGVAQYLRLAYRLEPRTIYPDIEGFARTIDT